MGEMKTAQGTSANSLCRYARRDILDQLLNKFSIACTQVEAKNE